MKISRKLKWEIQKTIVIVEGEMLETTMQVGQSGRKEYRSRVNRGREKGQRKEGRVEERNEESVKMKYECLNYFPLVLKYSDQNNTIREGFLQAHSSMNCLSGNSRLLEVAVAITPVRKQTQASTQPSLHHIHQQEVETGQFSAHFLFFKQSRIHL